MNERHAPGPRMLGNEIHHIRMAAAVEAMAFGHPEVDVEHLLLGLLVTGGPSAQVLTRAGVRAGDVRRGIRELQARDLGELGIHVAAPSRSPLRAASRFAGLALPLNDRARHLMETPSYVGDDRGLLLAVLDDDSRRVARLIEHLGIEADDLRDLAGRITAPATTPGPDGGRSASALVPRPAPQGAFWVQASLTHDLAVPRQQVWPLISHLSRRPEWDPFCVSVSTDEHGVEHLTRSGGDVVAQTVAAAVPEREITWLRFPATGAVETLHIVLTPVEGGTRLQLHRHVTARGWTWRLLRPLLVRMVRAQLRAQALGIGQAAS